MRQIARMLGMSGAKPRVMPYISPVGGKISLGITIVDHPLIAEWSFDASITSGSNPMVLGEYEHWNGNNQDVLRNDGLLSPYSNPIQVESGVIYRTIWDKPRARKTITGGEYESSSYGSIGVKETSNYSLGSIWGGNTKDYIKIFGFEVYDADMNLESRFVPIVNGNGFRDALGFRDDITASAWTYGEIEI